jgi:hypothetical protein
VLSHILFSGISADCAQVTYFPAALIPACDLDVWEYPARESQAKSTATWIVLAMHRPSYKTQVSSTDTELRQNSSFSPTQFPPHPPHPILSPR